MTRWLLVVLLIAVPRAQADTCLVSEPASSAGSITALFVARPIQGSTCVAPCTVHFDAVGGGPLAAVPYVTLQTTDSVFTRPLHSLDFLWDFDDAAGSCGATWANNGLSKNAAIGGEAGHTYCTAGTYDPTLRVTNPAGDVAYVTRTVTVVAPLVEFTDAETWCFANTAGTFQGCALDDDNDGTCEAGESAVSTHCIVTADLDVALTSNTDTLGCNSDAVSARCQFVGDDTYTNSASPLEPGTGVDGQPVLIEKIGSGADPVFAIGSAEVRPKAGATFSGIGFTGTAGAGVIRMEGDRGNISLYNSSLIYSGTGEGFLLASDGTTGEFPSLVGIVDTDFTGTAGRATSAAMLFGGGEYVVWQGGLIDDNQPTGVLYTWRAIGSKDTIFQHVVMVDPGSDPIQIRASDNVLYETDPARDPVTLGTARMIFSDNLLYPLANGGAQCIKFCADSSCTCNSTSVPVEPTAGNGYNGCSASLSGYIVPVHDIIIERNLCEWVGAGETSGSSGFNIDGGSFTIRNNVLHRRGSQVSSANFRIVYAIGQPQSWGDITIPSDYIDVYENTVVMDEPTYTGDGYSAASNTGFSGSGCTGGATKCRARGNLWVTSGALGAGGSLDVVDGSFTRIDGAQVASATDPFEGAMPAETVARMSDFVCSVGAACDGTGYDFSDTDTDTGNALDGRGLCRPATGVDAGAIERGAAACP